MADRYQDRPFPADGFGRGGNQSADADPLAELARLIGQNDPFAASGRATPQSQPRPMARPAAPAPEQPAAGMPPAGAPAWMQRAQPAAANPFADMGREPQQPAPAPPAFPAGYQDPRGQPPGFPEQDFAPAAAAPRQPQGYPNAEFADQLSKLDYSVGESRHGFAENDRDYDRGNGFDDNEQDSSRYDDALFGQMGSGQQGFQGDNDFQDGQYGYQDGYDEGEEEERPRRRSGMSTVLAVLTLAVVGTGGAYGYKTYISSGRTGEPPIIRADNSPTKIMAQQDLTPKVPDRLLGNDGGEKLVSREETPMDLNTRGGGNPRVVFPQMSQNGAPPPSAGAAPMSQMANANGILPNSDPRPIKTLSVTGGNQAAADPGGAAMPAAPATKPPATPKGRKSPANANASAAESPMPLTPQPAAPAPARIAAAVPVTEQTQPERTGGYLVSISSQASEAEAMTSYKAVQDKYGAVLGKYEPIIKRMDLGEKGGVKYRAAVGPFATKEEANKMCGTLKTAGGQCFPFSNN
ncbi:SPOR domain-containing protein [Bradyrhizobium aeschynomenes]|uniref:SPOR domain-containing protein n=1 Tax=Bradyrhizobium aeschynomenes TaxID=2734909 RepID=UPI001554237C|nr:SPOR domain-containing protein [Bradyrhizobium aeschynomenes]NPV23297.1 SPOR domain-containing protein [Bradyrhizobium aeschynomenes]